MPTIAFSDRQYDVTMRNRIRKEHGHGPVHHRERMIFENEAMQDVKATLNSKLSLVQTVYCLRLEIDLHKGICSM